MADLILTRNNSRYAKIVEYVTGTYWSHNAILLDDKVADFDYKGKKLYDLEEIIEQCKDYKIIENFLNDSQTAQYLDLFEQAEYENLYSLKRNVEKLWRGRDLVNIQSADNRYTCSSLLASVKHPFLPYHYSQIIPQDHDYEIFIND